MNRRDTLLALAALAAAPLARAQGSAMPVIGYLSNSTAASSVRFVAALRLGLSEAGYVEGKNVTIDYRYADGRAEQLPGFVADFVQHRVEVIFATGGSTTWVPAKAAMATIPLVFSGGSDPVKFGLVASLGRPGGNATGVTTNSYGLLAKRLQLFRGRRISRYSSPRCSSWRSTQRPPERLASRFRSPSSYAPTG